MPEGCWFLSPMMDSSSSPMMDSSLSPLMDSPSAPHQCRWVGCCLGAALSSLFVGYCRVWSFLHWPLVSWWTVTLIVLGLGFLRACLLRLCCTAAFPPIFLQLRKGPLWSCAELLQSYALCSSDQCRTVKLRLPAVRELFWGELRKRGWGVSLEIKRVILCRLIYIVMSFKPFNDIIMIVCKFLIGLCCLRSYST